MDSGQVFQSRFRVALIQAVVAGIIASLMLYILNGTANRYETAGTIFAKILVPALSSYILIALTYKTRWWIASIPSWLLVPLVGTALTLAVHGIPKAIIGWNHPLQQTPLTVYFVRWSMSAATFWVVFNVVLLPLSLILHYGRRIIQNLTG